jgi:hypothetical protein
MKNCIFLLLFFALNTAYSQEIPNGPAFDRNWLINMDSTSGKTANGLIRKPSLSNLSLSSYELNTLSNFNHSVPEIKMPSLPQTFDYTRNHYGIIPLNDNMFISTARINQNYIGLGGMSLAGANLNYFITDLITFSGGATFSKFNIYNDFRNEISFNGKLRFELSDRVFFNAFGSYAPQAGLNPNILRSLNHSMFSTIELWRSLRIQNYRQMGYNDRRRTGIRRLQRKMGYQAFNYACVLFQIINK